MAHHAPFKALCPAEWSSLADGGLSDFMRETFSNAQTLIDSMPLPHMVASAAVGRARSATDPSGGASVALNRALSPQGGGDGGDGDGAGRGLLLGDAALAKQLHREWREVKTNPRDNPLAINVYKLASKDGKGVWFARRSVHEGLSFDKFRLGLEREFAEALRIRNEHLAERGGTGPEPGAGKVRGIGAERRLEHETIEGLGKLEVYQLSAQFPGPTTPRDFITLLLTTAASGDDKKKKHRGPPAPRQFMVVSKPCIHPDCPPRQGYIRGQYESVEIIREIPIEVPLRKVRSSIDLSREGDGADLSRAEQVAAGREALLRSARRAGGDLRSSSETNVGRGGGDGDDDGDDKASVRSDVGTIKEVTAHGGEMETAVEWLMVTRSDPGGSVPRFMVEKGTPAGIISDAGRLLDWLASKDPSDFEESGDNDFKGEAVRAEDEKHHLDETKYPQKAKKKELVLDRGGETVTAVRANGPKTPTQNLVPNREAQAEEVAPSGFYNMIAGAIGAGASAVASRLPNPFGGSVRATDSEPDTDSDTDSDSSSVRTFSSAVESVNINNKNNNNNNSVNGASSINLQAASTSSISQAETDTTETAHEAASSMLSRESELSGNVSGSNPDLKLSRATTQHEKDLRKLQERRRKVQEKIAKMQDLSRHRSNQDKEKDELAARKLREKHEREMARQEEKYQRELKRLEEKRLAEEKKAAERRRKQTEREEKTNLALEVDRLRAERDVALKQIDLLKDQIGELQTQNTMLVATLGRHGLLKGAAADPALRDSKGKSRGSSESLGA